MALLFTCSDMDLGECGFGKGGAAAPIGCGASPSGPVLPTELSPSTPKSHSRVQWHLLMLSAVIVQSRRNPFNLSKTPSSNFVFTDSVTCTNANKSLDNLLLELYWG